MKEATNRLQELRISDRLVTKNRIVVPAMASQTADQDGNVTQATLSHYERLASSGAGLVFVEYSYVHRSGKSEPNQLAVTDKNNLEHLKKLVQTIKKQGVLAGIQLTHCGGKSSNELAGEQMHSPSGIAVPVKGRILETPLEAVLTTIQLWKESFLRAAYLAHAAGFDLIEIHSAHGYGLNQWISPITNHRTDSYGGSHANRFKLLCEIVRAIKSELPDLAISVRIPGKDFLEGGLENADCILLAQGLQSEGVALINVSSGIGGWQRPSDRIGEGYLIPEASELQKFLHIPVIGVGGIQSAAYADKLIRSGDVSLVAVGRAILHGQAGNLFAQQEKADRWDSMHIPSDVREVKTL